jgi:DNA invertase Pin-like site-specific DNA recombinase
MIATAKQAPQAKAGTLIPAVGYIRMSSPDQDASPAQQRDEIIKLAGKGGYRIIRWYEDPGISGDNTRKRKEFLRMIRDAAEKADFAAILCWDQDRFGRFDTIEAGAIIFPLRQGGIWLQTVTQGRIDWNTFQGRLIYSVTQEGKHAYLIDLSRNTLRGKIASAKKGRSASNPPIGYDRQFYDEHDAPTCRVKYGEKFRRPKGWSVRFVLSEAAGVAETVRWIWHTFDETDRGPTAIARDLNRRGVLTPNGTRWSLCTVEGILSNRVYAGANVFGRKRYGKYNHLGENGEAVEGRAGKIRKGDPIIADSIHDAYIDVATFQRAARKLAKIGQKQHRPRESAYLLSGLLRCGHCGGTMAGRGYTAKGAYPKRYYTCVTAGIRPGACACYQVPQEAIENYTLELIEKRLTSKEATDQIRAAIHQEAKRGDSFKATAKATQAQIAALDKKIARGSENLLLADPENMPDLSRLLADWRKERAALQDSLQRAAAAPGGMTPDQLANSAIAELKRLRTHLRAGDPSKVRAVLKSLVAEIPLWFEPYGKQKRLAKGYIRFHNELQVATCYGRAR